MGLFSAYYLWSRERERLEIVTVGEAGVGVMPAPIRPFCKVSDSVVDEVRAYRLSSGQHDITVEPSGFVDLNKEPVSIVSATQPKQIGAMREALHAVGAGHKQVLEADVPFIRNWMIEKDVRCAQHYRKLYYDIEVWDRDGHPDPRKPVHPIISIGAVDRDGVPFFFTGNHRTLEEAKASEPSILKGFTDLIVGRRYGLLTGWYSGLVGEEVQEGWFDYPYLKGRLAACKIPFRSAVCRWADLVIPYIYTREHKPKSTALDYVARELLSKGKKPKPASGHVADFTLDDLRSYNVGDEDNPGDAYLTKMVDEAAMGDGGSLTDLMTQLAYETHIFPDDVLYSPNIHTLGPKPSKPIDALLIEEARRNNYALPSKPSKEEREEILSTLPKGFKVKYRGAVIVRDPIPGLHRNILWLDVESLFPFCIVYGKVSPDPDGLILPNLMMRYLEKKRNAKNRIERTVYKILLNASYGSMGSVYTRIFNIDKAAAVTALSREIILYVAGEMEQAGWRVIYGDSVGRDSTIPVKLNGKWHDVPIWYLYNLFTHRKTNRVDKEELAVGADNIYTLSVSNGGVVSANKIVRIIKHKSRKKMYRVTTRRGRSLIVTEDHSIIKRDRDTLYTIPTKDLYIGDAIVCMGDTDALLHDM